MKKISTCKLTGTAKALKQLVDFLHKEAIKDFKKPLYVLRFKTGG